MVSALPALEIAEDRLAIWHIENEESSDGTVL
jgi:hypothetical protein